MKLFAVIIAFIVFSIFSGCSPADNDYGFDSFSAWEHLKKMETIADKCSYIDSQLKKSGLNVYKDSFVASTPLGDRDMTNIIAVIPGKNRDRFIILGTHYDIKELNPPMSGANDGLSGTSVLLALADSLKDPPYDVRLLFFDGEECIVEYNDSDGLFGSRNYADKLYRSGENRVCVCMINIDMVGDKDLKYTLSADTDLKLYRKLQKAAEKENLQKTVTFLNGIILDDHVPFKNIGIPSINIIDFNYGPGNSFWHTPHDNSENVSRESLDKTGRIISRMIMKFDEL